MKKLFLSLTLLLSWILSFGQNDSRLPGYGYEADRFRVLKSLEIPHFNTMVIQRKDSLRAQIGYKMGDTSSLWLYSPETLRWYRLGAGGGGTGSVDSVIYRNDSLFYYAAGVETFTGQRLSAISPLLVANGAFSINGLSGSGSTGQIPRSTGSGWQYFTPDYTFGLTDVLATGTRSFNTNGNQFKVTGGKVDFDSIKIDNGATGEQYLIRNRSISIGFPVVLFKPNSTGNKNIAFDIMPTGTPGDYNGTEGIAWMDICDKNVADENTAVTAARVGISSTAVQFGSRQFNGASAKPVQIVIGTSTKMQIEAATNSASFNIAKITQSQNLSGDYVGYGLWNTNTSVANSNPIFFIGDDPTLASLRFGFFRWNNAADVQSGSRRPNGFEIASNAGATGGMTIAALGGNTGNHIHLSTGSSGTERMKIDSAGNVGIAITSPQKKLHVNGTIRFQSLGTASADTTNNKPLAINSSGDIIPLTYWPGGSGGGGSGTINTGASNKVAFYPSAGTTIEDYSGLEVGLPNVSVKATSPNLTDTIFVIEGAASHTGDLFQTKVDGVTKTRFDATGKLYLPSDGSISFGAYEYFKPNGFNLRFTIPGDMEIFRSGFAPVIRMYEAAGSTALLIINNGANSALSTLGGANNLILQDPGQNSTGVVGIGITSPDASAKVDISSTTKGVLLPRMTGTQMGAISSPATGLMIYNTDSSAFCFYTGSAWSKIGSSGLSGDGSAITRIPKVLSSIYTDAGNIGSGEDDLSSYSIPGGTLSADGDFLDFTFTVTFAANTNNKQVKLYFGGTTVYASGAQAQNAGTMELVGRVIRTGATSQRISVSVRSNTTNFPDVAEYTTATETLSGSVTLKATGEATADNDIVQKLLTAELKPKN